MALVMDAKTDAERIERIETVLGISYTKTGNVAKIDCCFGGLSKIEKEKEV